MTENTSDLAVLLGRSAIRRRILGLLFERPERRLHLRAIARAVDASPGTVARELQRLVDAGLVGRAGEGRQVYFQADRDGPLFEPVQAIVQRTIGAPDLVRRHLADMAGIERAFLYGSYARGSDVRPESDVDLMIIGRPDLDELTDRVSAAERELARPVNYTVLTEDELSDRRRRGDPFIRSVDDGPKLAIIGHPDA